MQEDQTPMKQKLLEIVENLKNDNINLEETPVVFRWSYPEDPYIQYQLLIKETQQSNLEYSPTIH
jgi:hypothetical protein